MLLKKSDLIWNVLDDPPLTPLSNNIREGNDSDSVGIRGGLTMVNTNVDFIGINKIIIKPETHGCKYMVNTGHFTTR